MGSCRRLRPEFSFEAELCEDVFESPKWRPQRFTHKEISVCGQANVAVHTWGLAEIFTIKIISNN